MSHVADNHLTKHLVKLRRDFHKHPESGWIEYRTSSIIADLLSTYGYQVYVGENVCKSESRMGVPDKKSLEKHYSRALADGAKRKWLEKMENGHTGVVGVLKSEMPGPVIALRFDIDSLNLKESDEKTHIPTNEGFSSIYDDMMHACGHDGHAAIGLGVAKQLMEQKENLIGEIRLLFQPAEEGCRGAKSMVDNGWLNGVDYFFSGHIAFQSFQIGEIVAAVGGFLATTKLDVVYSGKASHAGDKPETGKNALLAAAAASLHLHAIPRHSSGKTRINVGKLEAGRGRNIIPDQATMMIETRGETTEINEYMKQETIRIIENSAKIYDVNCKWSIVGEAPGAQSDQELMEQLSKKIKMVDGVKSIIISKDLNASEDVVYMMNKVQAQGGKASYLLFGSPLTAGHHETNFDFDERVLPIGVNVFEAIVLNFLKQG